MKIRNRIAPLALSAALALGVAACGDDAADPGTDGGMTETEMEGGGMTETEMEDGGMTETETEGGAMTETETEG